ncbi:hypothetical protein T06_8887 [Trichinella sp. T6]|nr:hypothetical protein T06_8887 [Trichinella sp. T6]
MFSGHVNPGVDIFFTFTDLVIMRNKYEFLKMHFFVKFYGRLIVDHDVQKYSIDTQEKEASFIYKTTLFIYFQIFVLDCILKSNQPLLKVFN